MPKTLDPSILTYLSTQRVGVLAVEMLDGSPHAATVHFAHSEDPFVFYFETCREYRKAEPLLSRGSTRATLVIGTNEIEMKSLQMDGEAHLLNDHEREAFDTVYFGKFPDRKEKQNNANFLPFVFVPTWWRFTDWRTPEGKRILVSE